jgi:hypothetical protein
MAYDLHVHNAFDAGNTLRGQVGGVWAQEIKIFWAL